MTTTKIVADSIVSVMPCAGITRTE